MSFDPEQKIGLDNFSEGAFANDKDKQEFMQEQLKFDSLTEPVWHTIKRDLLMIWTKLTYVMFPRKVINERAAALRDWDLWGPLFLCLLLSFTLSFSTSTNDGSMVFEIIFVIVWLGAGIVAINGQLLGGNISFFQSVCVLGYCIFPLNIASIVIFLLKSILPMIAKMGIACFAFLWASYSSVGFISSMVIPEKKGLAAFPVFLFYLFLSWFILL